MDTFLTIKDISSGSYRESGSRFLSFAYPVGREEDIETILENIRKVYHDATHHCYAYILENDPPVFKAHDAGEPRHSAGDPILNQIRSAGVYNVLVVVIRYFGGTKLGIPGLTNAYKLAARSALENAVIIKAVSGKLLTIRFNPADTGRIMALLKSCKLLILDYRFTGNNEIQLNLKKSGVSEFRVKLKSIDGIEVA